MKELVGKVVTGIFVNEDESFLKFATTEGDILYHAEGDCCSETWFADIIFSYHGVFDSSGVSILVSEVEVLDIPEWMNGLATKDGRCRQEYDQVYGYKLKFKRRTYYGNADEDIVIVYRNSSNGYYGGDCEFIKDENRHYFKEQLDSATWTQITDDWRA